MEMEKIPENNKEEDFTKKIGLTNGAQGVVDMTKFLKFSSFLTLGITALSTVVPSHGLSTLALSVVSMGLVAANALANVSAYPSFTGEEKKVDLNAEQSTEMKKRITKNCFLALGSVVAVHALANQGLIQDGFVGALQLTTAFTAVNSLVQIAALKSSFNLVKEEGENIGPQVEKKSFMSKIGNLRNTFFSNEKESTLKLGG